ncbi:MAG TPA: hypothetical protein VI072_10080 [Polyangiaceae bacterium]
MAMFIEVTVNNDVIQKSEGVADKLVEVCPVKIFAPGTAPRTVSVVEDNVDECTLCELCLKTCPDGVKVKKLYED